jgi:hypothetical protein
MQGRAREQGTQAPWNDWDEGNNPAAEKRGRHRWTEEGLAAGAGEALSPGRCQAVVRVTDRDTAEVDS